MYMREPTGLTLKELDDNFVTAERGRAQAQVLTSDVGFFLEGEADHMIRLGDIEVPATPTGLRLMGKVVDVPTKFLLRTEPDLQQTILSRLFSRGDKAINVIYGDGGVLEVREPGQNVVPVSGVTKVLRKVLSDEGQVIEAHNSIDLLRIDVTVPGGYDRGIGGDPEVGDLSFGGLTVEQDRKRNLAPSLSSYIYRLWCTNGQVHLVPGDKIDLRGQTVEDVLTEMESLAQRVFSRVEDQISAFYDLRGQKVDNPERTVIRMGEEAGLPGRTVLKLAELVPSVMAETPEVTMFDLVNLITNQANDPALRHRLNVRRALEAAGGQAVTEHIERCSHCQQRVVHSN